MAAFTIRNARREDCKEIRRLIQELADFERMPEGPKITEKDLERDGFDRSIPCFYCYVVDDPNDASKLIGYALYYYGYGTWKGKRIFLEDIYVTDAYRGKKLGNALFQKVVQTGVEENCAEMDFIVLNWNPAQDFYKARGARDITKEEQWHIFRLKPAALKELRNNSN